MAKMNTLCGVAGPQMSEVGRSWRENLIANPEAYADTSLAEFNCFRESVWLKLLLQHTTLTPGSKVLEAGCGSGKFSVALATLGCEVVAMDYSYEALERAKALAQNVSSQFGELNISFIQGSIQEMGFDVGGYDLTMNEGVVEHWLKRDERLTVLREMVRVTRPGGTVAVFVPNGTHPLLSWWVRSCYPGYDAPDMTLYNAQRLREELAEAGCTDVITDGIGAWASLYQWPNWKVLRYGFGAIGRVIPLPKPIREKWGVSIAAFGKVPNIKADE